MQWIAFQPGSEVCFVDAFFRFASGQDLYDSFPAVMRSVHHLDRIRHEEHKDAWIFWSEDYGFMHHWKQMGGKIILDPSIKLIHWGLKGYGAG